MRRRPPTSTRLPYTTLFRSWQTLSATVTGWVGDREVAVEVVREASGRWRLGGQECSAVAGCTDVDLNFSPSTKDRKSTRLNSSHSQISYAVFCLKKKNQSAR